jgi:hypothetical protein
MVKMILVSILVSAIITLSIILLQRLKQNKMAPQPIMIGHRSLSPVPPTSRRAPLRIREQQRHWLIGIAGEVEGNTYHIGNRTVTLGLAVSNFIQVDHKDASRVHCRLAVKHGKLEVTDMNSQNQTFVNQQPITIHQLKDGELLTIANNVFEYKFEGNYQNNAAFARKNPGSHSYRPTVVGDDSSLEELIERALERAGGDVLTAAQLSNIRLDKIQQYVANQQEKV